jgi:hypothetical protein
VRNVVDQLTGIGHDGDMDDDDDDFGDLIDLDDDEKQTKQALPTEALFNLLDQNLNKRFCLTLVKFPRCSTTFAIDDDGSRITITTTFSFDSDDITSLAAELRYDADAVKEGFPPLERKAIVEFHRPVDKHKIYPSSNSGQGYAMFYLPYKIEVAPQNFVV